MEKWCRVGSGNPKRPFWPPTIETYLADGSGEDRSHVPFGMERTKGAGAKAQPDD